MNIETGGPVFPCPQDDVNQNMPSLGMTLRDWFAAMALQGLCANSSLEVMKSDIPLEDMAYSLADKMIGRREI